MVVDPLRGSLFSPEIIKILVPWQLCSLIFIFGYQLQHGGLMTKVIRVVYPNETD